MAIMFSFPIYPWKYLADPGEARGCSTNTTATPKSDYWFKSYSDFADCVDFADWRSFSGGWFTINGATPSSFLKNQCLSMHHVF